MGFDSCHGENSFCNRLNDYLMDRFSYKKNPAMQVGITVSASRKKFDLYFRLFNEVDEFWEGKAIVISRLGFQKPNRGHGSALLRFIIEYAKENNFDVIGIEQAGTPSITAFAEKFGFKEIGNTKNYTAHVTQLESYVGTLST